ncbi:MULTISPECIES: GNAT family N-acetyltransferase [Oceanospirillaceae]|jgi:ribosomal protein S18 acetylase RimI-like enzyme|uniref:GNAT family N-acetyltransferase n=1 Tax=Oceanobacter antarcticus TaxID=3133425 RepID=A0ABW8NMA3_9GAMM|tara:strand:- start:3474 stop:3977 length:504 start_codon:yes stop_codon:yes gene_type:complete
MTEVHAAIDIVAVDFLNPRHAADLVALLNAYATDPMGGGEPLPLACRASLVARLATLPYAHSWIAYVNDQPAGLLNAFEGFSTFKAQPLLNIHDLAVNADFRGLGLSQQLLAAAEHKARLLGCCKVTLEVLSNNHVAQQAYLKYGFAGYELDPEAGHALFWQKMLDN